MMRSICLYPTVAVMKRDGCLMSSQGHGNAGHEGGDIGAFMPRALNAGRAYPCTEKRYP